MENNDKLDLDFVWIENDPEKTKLKAEQESNPGAIIHYCGENEHDLYIGDCRMTDNFNTGTISDSIKTLEVGGLKASTIGELKEKSVSQILLDILREPVSYPTKLLPTLTISYTGSSLVEVGSVLPDASKFNSTVNCRKYPDGTNVSNGHGAVTYTMTPDKFGQICEEGTYKVQSHVDFFAGENPKDSYGNPCPDDMGLKFEGGTMHSSNITITAVYPIFTGISNQTMTKKVVNYNTEYIFNIDIPAEEDDNLNKFRIYLPYEFSKFEVKEFNSVSGKYDIDTHMELLDEETDGSAFVSNGIKYIRYIRTKDVKDTKIGSTKYEIKLKK